MGNVYHHKENYSFLNNNCRDFKNTRYIRLIFPFFYINIYYFRHKIHYFSMENKLKIYNTIIKKKKLSK